MDFFYDKQIESYLLQFIRIFSEVKIETDPDEQGVRVQKRVPVKYGDMSRMVGHIIRDNNQNVILPSPSMTVSISSLKPSPKRRQDTQFVGTMSGTERHFNNKTQQYDNKMGNKYTVYRYMPVPYDLELNLDILTPNTQTKLQILEQLLTLFNPSIQITHNENPFDWTSVQEIFLEDVTWSNRNIPVGQDSKDDVATLKFKSEIWLSIPAKIKRQRLIEQIVTNMYNTPEIDKLQSIDDVVSSPLLLSFHVLADNNMIDVELTGNNVTATILNNYGAHVEGLTWETFIANYGTINSETLLVLKTNNDIESSEGDIYGNVSLDPNDPSKLIFVVDPDTLPPSIDPVDRFIDATRMYPGSSLPLPQAGQRYLLLSNYTNNEEPAIKNSPVWGTTFIANEFDIIEFSGSEWFVSFDSRASDQILYVKNLYDGQHYRYDGNEWLYTYLGKYNPEYWRLENLSPPP